MAARHLLILLALAATSWASEGSDQFARLLDRKVTIDLGDVTIDQAFAAIIAGAPKQDLPLITGSRSSSVGEEMLTQQITLRLGEVTVREAFNRLELASGGLCSIGWDESPLWANGGGPTIRPSEKLIRQQEAEREAAMKRFRIFVDDLAARLAAADHLIVSRLGDIDAALKPGKDSFPIPPYQAFAPITGRRELTKEASTALLTDLAAVIKAQAGNQALCHEPAWGVEVIDATGTTIFRTSLCFECSNYYLEFAGESHWAPIPAGESADQLKKRLSAILP